MFIVLTGREMPALSHTQKKKTGHFQLQCKQSSYSHIQKKPHWSLLTEGECECFNMQQAKVGIGKDNDVVYNIPVYTVQ